MIPTFPATPTSPSNKNINSHIIAILKVVTLIGTTYNPI
jgi:hypothetical protein